jgi:hypothetical protein
VFIDNASATRIGIRAKSRQSTLSTLHHIAQDRDEISDVSIGELARQ